MALHFCPTSYDLIGRGSPGVLWLYLGYEPMVVVLPEEHPLAARSEVPLAALAGETVYPQPDAAAGVGAAPRKAAAATDATTVQIIFFAGAGNARTLEWTDLARRLFEGRGIRLAPPLPLAVGDEEFERITAKTRNPLLAVMDFPAMPRTVRRPLVDPVPLSPVSLVWRKGLVHPGLDALRRAATEIARAEGWLQGRADGWIPATDERVMSRHN